MPSTAPTLTWEMTNTRNTVTPGSEQSVLDTIALAVGDLTRWEVKSSAAGYIEIGPIAASAIPNLRCLIAFGVNNAQVASPHANATGRLFMGFAPDGGTLGDPLGAAAPYGAARWTGYWKICKNIPGGEPVNTVFAVGSDEVFSIWLCESAPEDWWGGICGAMIDPPTDADGEGTPGRIYAMSVTGEIKISNTFWSDGNGLLGSGGGNADSITGAWRPDSPTTFADVDRLVATAPNPPRFKTVGGTQVSMPVGVYMEQAPNNFLGVYRQIRLANDGMMRQIIQDGALVDQSFYVGPDRFTNFDVASFDNG